MLIILIWLQVTIALGAPLQFPLVHLSGTMQQQQLALQEQMLALQQFQAMQRINALSPVPMTMSPPQPLLILFPNNRENIENENRVTKLSDNSFKNKPELSEGIEDEDTDSITIDAQDDNAIENNNNSHNFKAVLLLPNNGRFSIGGIISAIPFLPFEINVPDSISWIWNGISGIISGVGQGWPFRPNNGENGASLKNNWKVTNNEMPIVVIPLGQPMVPMKY